MTISMPRGRRRRLILTVDVEEDISTHLDASFIGIEEGLPALLDLFREMGLRACFFLLGHVCEKFPEPLRSIVQAHHQIGSHGYSHTMLYFKSARWQRRQLERANAIIERTTGVQPRLFRATRFSATARTLRVLEDLGYVVDSSILPDSRASMARGVLTIRSTSGAPYEPYRPSRRNVLEPGDMNLWEVPLTPNRLFPGAPLAMGGLNLLGSDQMVRALRLAPSRDVVFLIHPWEFADLGRSHPELPQWVKELCAPNREALSSFLSLAQTDFDIGPFDLNEFPTAPASGFGGAK